MGMSHADDDFENWDNNNNNNLNESVNFGENVDLTKENQKLKSELAQLQQSLLESLKRQDRFISGGQFKGPPAKNLSETAKNWSSQNNLPRQRTRSEISFE